MGLQARERASRRLLSRDRKIQICIPIYGSRVWEYGVEVPVESVYHFGISCIHMDTISFPSSLCDNSSRGNCFICPSFSGLKLSMLPLNSPPCALDPSEPPIPPDLSFLRSNVLSSTNDPSSSVTAKIDAHITYLDALLNYYYFTTQDPVLENEITITSINASYFYQLLAQDLLTRAYTDNSTEAWSRSGSYNKKSIGILQFLLESAIPRTTELLTQVQTYILCWTLFQQLGIVVLSVSKLRGQLYGYSAKRPGYETLLDFQESDLKELSKSSSLYARLCIGCRDSCTKLLSTHLSKDVHYLIRYLDALTFLLLSMDQYKQDQCGVALGMLNSAVDSLSQGLLSSKDLKLIHDTKFKDKLKGKIPDLKGMQLKQKLKFSGKKGIETNVPSTPTKYNKGALHPLLNNTLQDFIIPLTMLLQYRYTKTNEKLSFQPIIRDRQQILKLWPQGKTPEVNGTKWVFEDGS